MKEEKGREWNKIEKKGRGRRGERKRRRKGEKQRYCKLQMNKIIKREGRY